MAANIGCVLGLSGSVNLDVAKESRKNFNDKSIFIIIIVMANCNQFLNKQYDYVKF